MTDAFRVHTVPGMAAVEATAWDALVGDDNPFVEHAFLATMEEAGCVGGDTGWIPQHLLVRAVDTDEVVGATPMYVKDNSQGEYIFDWGWANASQRAGIAYYPKLVSAVPFTPATGPRLLVRPGAPTVAVREALHAGAMALAEAIKASSIHWLFTTKDEAEALGELGALQRLSHQYHWVDDGYGDFDGFLDAMTSKRRKEVRRERRQATCTGLAIDIEPITALSRRDLADLHRCYRDTIDTRYAIPYLSRDWYDLLPTRLGERTLVATAREADGRLVAASLAFRKGPHLYGRYWGSTVDVPGLHFELCYYRFIEYALEHGIRLFEAGAQGQHKIQRGFVPRACHSAHWIRHRGLSGAVAEFLERESEAVEHELVMLARGLPFKEETS